MSPFTMAADGDNDNSIQQIIQSAVRQISSQLRQETPNVTLRSNTSINTSNTTAMCTGSGTSHNGNASVVQSMNTTNPQSTTPTPRTHQWPAPSFRPRPRRIQSEEKASKAKGRKNVSKDIFCLPYDTASIITIPRGKQREFIAKNGMSGKISVHRDMSPSEVEEEIGSVFQGTFQLADRDQFMFDYLSVLPGSGKKLQRPRVSSHFKWGGAEVLSTCGQGCLYIMCDIKYRITMETFFNKEDECTAKRMRKSDLAIDETSDDDDDDELDDIADILQPKTTTPQQQASSNMTPHTPAISLRGHTQVASTSSNSEANNVAYNTYASLWIDLDQENYDEDFPNTSLAIENSMQVQNQPSTSSDDTSALTLSDVISQYAVQGQDRVPFEETQVVVVYRRRLMTSVVYAIQKPHFEFDKLVRVEFVGEEGVDIGGPRREMFRLLMKAVVNEMGILEGKEGSQYFTHNVDLIEKEAYLLAGKLVRWSVTQGGPALPVLMPALYNLMFEGDLKCTLTHECVTDYEVHEKLHRLASCTEEDFPAVADSLADWAGDRGVTALYGRRFAQWDQIVKALVKQHIFYRAQSEILQFKKGLGNLTVSLEQFPALLKSLFTTEGYEPLTRDVVKQLSTISWSLEESNLRLSEEDTVYSWEICLQECQDGSARTSLQDVLVFITAADCIPPLGFTNKLSIVFYSPTSDRAPQCISDSLYMCT